MIQRRESLATPLAAAALALSIGCASSEDIHFTLYSTLATTGGSTQPNTLVSVDHRTGIQVAAGDAGGTPAQTSLAWDPGSGSFYGVNPIDNPGVITRIEPKSGTSSTAVTAGALVGALKFSPAGESYVLVYPRMLAKIDLSNGWIAPVGDLKVGTFVASFDFQSDGTLYALVVDQAPDGSHSVIVTADPATAVVTSMVPVTNSYAVQDIACAPDGFIYATNFSWELLRMNPKTGGQTAVGFGEIGALGGLAMVR